MNDRQKKFLSVVGICLFLLFIIIFGNSNTRTPMPVLTTEPRTTEPLPKVLPDFGISFEEFQAKYNENAIIKKIPQYVLREGKIRKYGVYNLCLFSYATMKVEIDKETNNISRIEVYGEYTRKLSASEKQALFLEQKQIFENLADIVEINGDSYKYSAESILRSSLEDWKDCAVTLAISAKEIPHVSENKQKMYKEEHYLYKGAFWMDLNGVIRRNSRKVKIKWAGRSIILSNGENAYQFEFLEGIHSGEFGYWSKSFY